MLRPVAGTVDVSVDFAFSPRPNLWTGLRWAEAASARALRRTESDWRPPESSSRNRVKDPSTVFNRPTTMRRYFPQLAAGRWDKPPVDELTLSLTDDLAIVDVWAGSTELRIPEVQGEDMHMIAPLRVGRGYRLGMAYTVTDLRILKTSAGSLDSPNRARAATITLTL